MKKDIGIYKFTNKINGKVYIGQTRYLNSRYREHKSELINGIHHNEYLQKSVNKYGFDNFDYEIICRCNEDELDEKELYYINLYDSTNRNKGYNIHSGGENNRLSKETIEKIRKSHYGTNSKLTPKQVESIKLELLEGFTDKELADKYNVDHTTINKIGRCKNWKQVRSDLNDKNEKIKKNKKDKEIAKIKKENTEKIVVNMFLEGHKIESILEATGITYPMYKRITKGLTAKRDKLRYEKIMYLKSKKYTRDMIAKELKLNKGTITEIIKRFSLQDNTEVNY